MQSGDLIKFKGNGRVGLLLREIQLPKDSIEILWSVLWCDGTKSNRWLDELEIVNASR